MINKTSEQLFKQITDKLMRMGNCHLINLVGRVLASTELMEAFKVCPGAVRKNNHHSRTGGLLEHTYEMMRLSATILELYPKTLDKDLLTTAIFLHDLGKVIEYNNATSLTSQKYSYLLPERSVPGKLLGHISIGAELITLFAKGLDIPEPLLDKLIHCVLSHHGKKE